MPEFLRSSDLTLGPLYATFILGITTFILLLWYSVQKQKYWKKIGIPYARTLPFAGSAFENLQKSVHDIELERYNKYGRIYGHFEGNRPLLSVAEPELLRHILVKDFPVFHSRRFLNIGDKVIDKMLSAVKGEDWKRIRTIVTPTFTTGKIKRMLNIFKECSRTVVENFKKAANKGEPIEIKRFYGGFTMDIIASSAFSTKIDSHNDPDNPFVKTAKEVFTTQVNWRFLLLLIFPALVRIFKIKVFSEKVLTFFTSVTLQIIEERKKTGETRNDFLQLLMDTANELSEDGTLNVNEKGDIAENYGKEENDHFFKQNMHLKKTLSQDELLAQCIIFFVAGYDTTASTLAFTSYLLALNPDIQEQLIQELDDVLGQNDGELEYEAVQSMKYLDNVISETLRLFPPVARLERTADENYKLGNTGVTIPRGMIVTIPAYAMHRDPKLYPDPEKFDPDRFSPEERAKRDQFAYLPFGIGPRNCVAMRFALMEIKVCLIHVLSNFRIKKCPQTKVPLEFGLGQGLLQPKAITLQLEVRKDTVKAL